MGCALRSWAFAIALLLAGLTLAWWARELPLAGRRTSLDSLDDMSRLGRQLDILGYNLAPWA